MSGPSAVAAPPLAPDRWLDAARALRLAAVDAPGVVGLSRSAVFQTQGRGPAVLGLALSHTADGRVLADVGIEAEAGADLAALQRRVHERLVATWARLRTGAPLIVCVHVVDLVGTLAAAARS